MRISCWFVAAALLGAVPVATPLAAQPAPSDRLAPRVENFIGSEEVRSARLEQARVFVKGEGTRQVAGIRKSVYRFELRRIAGRTQLMFQRRLVDGRISAQHPSLHSERPLPPGNDISAVRQLKTIMCGGIPPGAQRNPLCPVDTDRRIAINSNGRPLWLAGEVEVAVEATAGMTRVVITVFERR